MPILRTRALALLLVLLAAGCAKKRGDDLGDDVVSVIRDAGIPPFGDGGPVEIGGRDGGSTTAACVLPDAGVVQLTALADLCERARAGFLEAWLESARANTGACGERFSDEELWKVSPLYGGLDGFEVPSCESGGFGAGIERLERSVALGRIAWDPAAADACRALGRTRDGGAPVGPDGSLLAPCLDALRPLVPAGGACDIHDECITSFCKPTALDSCGGRCAEILPLLAPCSPRRDRCPEESECEREPSGDFRCLPKRALGGPCEDSGDCRQGLGCVAGSCRAPVGPDAPCGQGVGECADGLVCTRTATGASCWRPSREGEPCGRARGGLACEHRCLACDPSTSICVRLGAAGAPCPNGDRDCLPSLSCGSAGRCVARPRTGERCTIDGAHPSGDCAFEDDYCRRDSEGASTGVCTAKPLLCEACGPSGSTSCREGSCRAIEGAGARCEPAPPPPLPGIGDPCPRDQRCAEGLRCTGSPPICAPKIAVGGQCTEDAECVTALCDTASMTCAVPCVDGCANPTLSFYGYLLFFGVVLDRRRRRSRS